MSKRHKKNTTKPKQPITDNVTGTLKKIISVGSATDLSKELISSAIGQVSRTKDEISGRVTQEMISLIRKIDFVKEFSKFAENHKFKVSAEIEIIKKNKEK